MAKGVCVWQRVCMAGRVCGEGGMCGKGGRHVWQMGAACVVKGGLHGKGDWGGAYVAEGGGMHSKGGHARRSLKWAVCILLEYILVYNKDIGPKKISAMSH